LRYFFEISYDGTSFFGWQKQPDRITVQQTIEISLSKIYSNKQIDIVGCGRTDTGVHAKQYIFHADLPHIENPKQLCYTLNKMLPPTVCIKKCWSVNDDMHARYSATRRTYRYFIHFEKEPFKHRYSYYLPHTLDIEKMNIAATNLIGTHDFTTFSKTNTDTKTSICSVFEAKWKVFTENNREMCFFEYSANRFLRNMVRATVGTLLKVGQDKISNNEFIEIFHAYDRQQAFSSAPPQGLFLWKIDYKKNK